jgi:chaperonin cofactor prefoldin
MLDASQQAQGRARAQARAQQQTPAPPAPPPAPSGEQQELQALVAKRTELAQQLEALTERRDEVANQLHGTEAPARPGLVARLQALDERIARLEQEILQADDAIAAGVAAGIIVPPVEQTETIIPPEIPVFSDQAMTFMVGEALAFVLLGIVLYQLGWRRAKARFARGAPDESGRIDQLQNSVDAIAVEIERISEGQRYVSKVLNEGAQQPVATAAQKEAIPVRRPV